MTKIIFQTAFSWNKRFTSDDTDIRHWSITRRNGMLCIAWSLHKGEWWKLPEEKKARFFTISWRKPMGNTFQTGIFIGRLGIVLQQKKKCPQGEST